MRFVQAGSYHRGRRRPIRLLVVHSTQGPGAPTWAVPTAQGIAGYFSRSPGVSSHYVCDPVETIQCVRDEDTAWTAPGANADGIHVEQCGYAEWSRVDWLTNSRLDMLAGQVAPLLAALAARHSIPLRRLSVADVQGGARGVCDHWDVTRAFRGGTHWDCGSGYPLDAVLDMARQHTTTPAATRRTPPVSVPATLRPDTAWTYDLHLPAEGSRIPNQAGDGPKVAASTLVVRQLVVDGVSANTLIVWGSGKDQATRKIGGQGEVERFPCAYTGLVSVVSDRPLAVHGEIYTS